MEEFKEDKNKENNYCKACKKYYKKSISGTCPVCGGKLATYRPNRHYFKDDTKEQLKYMAKLININDKLEMYDSKFRTLSRDMESLNLRYQQIINLLKGILRFSAMSKRSGKNKLTIAKLMEWMKKVVDEPEEKEIDLVDEIVNPQDLKGDTN